MLNNENNYKKNKSNNDTIKLYQTPTPTSTTTVKIQNKRVLKIAK